MRSNQPMNLGSPPQNKRPWVKIASYFIATLFLLFGLVAHAESHPWQQLTPMQKEALAPMSQQWDSLSESQQEHLLSVAQHYPKLSSEAKQRYQTRLAAWSKLTPAQRQAAREKYQAFSKVPEEKRAEVKRMVKESQAQKTQSPANN